jgi:hypothetical protein
MATVCTKEDSKGDAYSYADGNSDALHKERTKNTSNERPDHGARCIVHLRAKRKHPSHPRYG